MSWSPPSKTSVVNSQQQHYRQQQRQLNGHQRQAARNPFTCDPPPLSRRLSATAMSSSSSLLSLSSKRERSEWAQQRERQQQQQQQQQEEQQKPRLTRNVRASWTMFLISAILRIIAPLIAIAVATERTYAWLYLPDAKVPVGVLIVSGWILAITMLVAGVLALVGILLDRNL